MCNDKSHAYDNCLSLALGALGGMPIPGHSSERNRAMRNMLAAAQQPMRPLQT